jgi:Uma2 family endonuclease
MGGREETMSTVARRKPSGARAKRVIRPLEGDDAEARIVFRGVGWEVYDALSDALPEGSSVRMIYDGKDLEIIMPSNLHDHFKDLLGLFVHEVAVAMLIPMSGAGQTTWKRQELDRGLEADQSFYFLSEKLPVVAAALKRRSRDIADYPNPDLTVEVNLSPTQVDRENIYKQLRVAEIWYFDGNDATIEQLGEDGNYVVTDTSRFLPIRAVEIRRWLLEEDYTERTSWLLRLRAWLRRISRTRKRPTPRPRRRKPGS